MLSKFIYKALMVFALAFFAQVGYSQNYVSTNEALVILQDLIEDAESDLTGPPASTGQFQAFQPQTELKFQLALYKALKTDVQSIKDVKATMDTWYDKANAQGPERKTKLTLALNSVKNLLS